MKQYAQFSNIIDESIQNLEKVLYLQHPTNMYAPMGYILQLGGKRIRPLLVLIANDLYHQEPTKALNIALAVEVFHNFSLIHDDVLDNATMRRHKETVHTKWNNNIAILSGDGMLLKAFEMINASSINNKLDIYSAFIDMSLKVCEGQQLDMDFETLNQISVDDYINMITLKTATLIACSLQLGGICANASIQDQQLLYKFGKHIGIAFQIIDDMLDLYAQNNALGKEIGKDILENKKTILFAYALNKSKAIEKEMLLQLYSSKNTDSTTKLNTITNLYNNLNVKQEAVNLATQHTNIAFEALQLINTSAEKKQMLIEFAQSLIKRNF